MQDGELLCLAAFAPELEALPEGFERALVGVGLVPAALGAARAADRARALGRAGAVLLGTCGAYPGSGLAVGDVVVASRAILVDAALVDGRAAFVGGAGAPVALHAALAARFAAAGARLVSVATTLGVTTDDSLAQTLAGSACAVEHLEAYAVARAFDEAAIPLAIVLGVANDVGSKGRDQWQRHHQGAAAAAARLAARALRSSTTERSRG